MFDVDKLINRWVTSQIINIEKEGDNPLDMQDLNIVLCIANLQIQSFQST